MSLALKAVVLDSQSNQSFEATFERFPVRIGRNQLSDLRLDRPYVSQFHASLDLSSSRILVKDLGSTNGTVHRGQRLVREQPVDVTSAPELQIGPIVIRLSVHEVSRAEAPHPHELTVLDAGTPEGARALEARRQPLAPGPEDPYVRQLAPYVEAYRSAWSSVYRLIYDHLQHLPPEVRDRYLRRLAMEQPGLAGESDFQRLAQYYGVAVHEHAELTMPLAALAAMNELAAQLAPDAAKLDAPDTLLAFASRLRDSMSVFLKCFVSLRDGYQEFEAEVLRRERASLQGEGVAAAKDHRALAQVLFTEGADSEANCRALHEVFVEVMTHQVALLNGVMEGVKQLLETLSPEAVEKRYERKGKRGGLFSNKYEGLWEEYQTVHADYRGEDKETFLIIFGPQFSRAYAATSGEALQTSGDAAAGRVTKSGGLRR